MICTPFISMVYGHNKSSFFGALPFNFWLRSLPRLIVLDQLKLTEVMKFIKLFNFLFPCLYFKWLTDWQSKRKARFLISWYNILSFKILNATANWQILVSPGPSTLKVCNYFLSVRLFFLRLNHFLMKWSAAYVHSHKGR